MKNYLFVSMLVLTTGPAMTGCASPPLAPTTQFAPVHSAPVARSDNYSGSLFVDGRGDNFFGRQRDYQVGDVITVILSESTQASRTQNTTISRTATNDAFPTVQAGLSGALRNSGLPLTNGLASAAAQIKADGAKMTSDGTGNAGQLATLTGSIAVSVVEVMSNGNLVVRGEKQLALSEGSEVIQVSGVVRTQDVAPNGTVLSRRLANAQIAYRGSGELANAAQPGWGTRVLMRLWPF